MKKQKLKQIIIEVLTRKNVKRASFFGSYARNDYNKNSDVDILIEFNGDSQSLLDLIGIKQELEEKTRLNIDLLTFDSINSKLKQIILKEQEIIYD